MNLKNLIRSNTFFQCTKAELDNLRRNQSRYSDNLRRKIDQAYYILYYRADGEFPVTDMAKMVMLIHESICPTCGRQGHLTLKPARWARLAGREWGCDWDVHTLECIEGHKHTAEPDSSATDWVAW